jgi:LytS/YehU family sensor histidine kinase
MTARSSLPVCVALFLVGGWGLGRDIAFEASLLRERRRADALAREAEHAQLLAIRSHLDPHFLFNTLNAIAEFCREDGEVAEQAVLQLSAILRAVLAGVRSPSWPLATELGLVRDLFALHLLRDPSLFTLEWDVPSTPPNVPVLPMVLLPLAENAVKHGPGAGHRGALRFAVRVEGERIHVELENPGPYGGPREGSQGLPTVARRLDLAYPGGARITIAAAGERTRVELDLPCAGPERGVNV